MLSVILFKALEKRGLITKGRTEVDANYSAINPFGEDVETNDVFLLENYRVYDNYINFSILHSYDGKRYHSTNQDITMIDGMEPIRLASAYDIDENGLPTIFFIDRLTDCSTEIIGQIEVEVDGVKLKTGNRIVLQNDKDHKMSNIIFTVRESDDGIILTKPRGRPRIVRSLDDLD